MYFWYFFFFGFIEKGLRDHLLTLDNVEVCVNYLNDVTHPFERFVTFTLQMKVVNRRFWWKHDDDVNKAYELVFPKNSSYLTYHALVT